MKLKYSSMPYSDDKYTFFTIFVKMSKVAYSGCNAITVHSTGYVTRTCGREYLIKGNGREPKAFAVYNMLTNPVAIYQIKCINSSVLF